MRDTSNSDRLKVPSIRGVPGEEVDVWGDSVLLEEIHNPHVGVR